MEYINYKTSTTTKQWTLETTYSALSLFFFESRFCGRSSSGENSNLFSRSFPLFPYLITKRSGDDFRSLTSIALSELLFRISHDVNPRETLPLERLGVLLD